MSKFYVTYSCASPLSDCYSIIESNSFMEAREQALKITGGAFSYFYDQRDFDKLLKRHSPMKAVPLQAQMYYADQV